MDVEKLTDALRVKMGAEQDKYRAWLVAQPPEEILNHTAEYTTREDILMAMDFIELTKAQVSALLDSPTPLADVYKNWSNMDFNLMDNITSAIEDRADTVIRQTEELNKSPVYKYPFEYARDNDELEQYHTSRRVNTACKREVEAAISKYHDGYRFESEAAVRDVVQKFGYERTFFVLAATVQNNQYDGRYSRSNKDWARTVPVFDSERSTQYAVTSHPVLVDAFLATARHEHLLRQPLKAADIKAEATHILERFQAAREPNSPSGTHYMVQVSPDFLARAGSKDTDRLMSMLPFQSLSLSTLEGQKGTYALILKDENRFQPLVLRRPSVKKKLEEKAAAVAAPSTSSRPKSKEQER